MGVILFVDDELELVRPLIEALEQGVGMPVVALSIVAEAIAYVRRSPSEVRLVVTDLMMPRAGLWDDRQTEGRLLTGLTFLAECRRLVGGPLPGIVLTNRNEPALLAEIGSLRRTRAGRKLDVMPEQLVAWARELLAGAPAAPTPARPTRTFSADPLAAFFNRSPSAVAFLKSVS